MGNLFDPEALYTIVNKAQGLEVDEALDSVVDSCAAEYRGHIVKSPLDWVLVPHRPMLGQVAVLHASLREYLTLFGAPIFANGDLTGPRVGHTWDFVLRGQLTVFEEGELEPRVFGPGEHTSVPPRRHVGVKLAAGTWILEYSRGPLIPILGAGLTSGLMNWRDPAVNLRISRSCLGRITRELAQGKV